MAVTINQVAKTQPSGGRAYLVGGGGKHDEIVRTVGVAVMCRQLQRLQLPLTRRTLNRHDVLNRRIPLSDDGAVKPSRAATLDGAFADRRAIHCNRERTRLCRLVVDSSDDGEGWLQVIYLRERGGGRAEKPG